MSVARERSQSLWMETQTYAAPRLDGAQTADVVVVGSGIAGLSAAYELLCGGASVIVIDRGEIARGMSARTTAHLSSEHDDTYDDLISTRGLTAARACYESQAAAIDRLDEIQRGEEIACDFRRLDGILFAPTGDDVSLLEKEFDACREVGFAGVDWVRELTLADSWERALRFPNQARFQPLKYLNGLAAVIAKRGGKLFANSAVHKVEEKAGMVSATADGGSISAQHAVVASNSPINVRAAIHGKQAPYRTFAFAAEVKHGDIADALYWDTVDPYHYVRLQPGDAFDFLIVGGEDYKAGEADDADARFERLEAWARDYFPTIGRVTHRWSGQVQEPTDGVAFIGRSPGNERVFLATGDSGQGFTNGPLAGMLISQLIQRGASPWEELYRPDRKMPKAALTFVSENITALKKLAEHLIPGEISSTGELKPGEGAIVRRGLSKIAAFRDTDGTLYERSATCTHLGCQIEWNSFERCWDCPCHGSHFAPDGAVLAGPAISPLANAEKQSAPATARSKAT